MAGDISGIETDDKTGEITVDADRAGHEDPVRARRAVRVAHAGGEVARQEPEAAAAGHRAVHDRRGRLQPRVRADERTRTTSSIPGVPAGNFDKITVEVGDNVTKMTQDVINGEARLHDRGPDGRPASARCGRSTRTATSRTANPPNTYYNFLNVTKPPFDKQEAREAFNYAIDSRALVRVFGGRLTPGCNFLPPGVTGYEELDCKYGDPNGEPDIEKAKELVEAVRVRGRDRSRSGRTTRTRGRRSPTTSSTC